MNYSSNWAAGVGAVLGFKLFGESYDWTDFKPIDPYTFRCDRDNLEIHCNTDVHDDYDNSYIMKDWNKFNANIIMGQFGVFSLVSDLQHIWNIVKREEFLEKAATTHNTEGEE